MIARAIFMLLLIAALVGLLKWSQRTSDELRVSGFIEAHETRVGSRVGGRVKAVHAEEGQIAKAGDVLVELDPFDLTARRAAAAAATAQSQAELSKLIAGNRPEEIAQAQARYRQAAASLNDLLNGNRPQEIAAAQAQLNQAQASLVLAQSDHDRTESLFQRKIASREELDQATSNLNVAKATVDARRQNLDLLQAGSREEQIKRARAQLSETSHALELMISGNRIEDIDAARAALDAAKAQVQVLDKQIDELTVRAPMAGRIEAVELRPGDLVAADAPLLSILDLSTMWVRAYVPENRLGVKVGQKVSVSVDSFPGRKFAAHLTFLSDQAEFTPNNVQTPEDRSKQVLRIKVTLDEGLDVLHPGMSADVDLGSAAAAAGGS